MAAMTEVSVCICPHIKGQDGSQHYLVQAKLAVLNKQFKEAEHILVERVG